MHGRRGGSSEERKVFGGGLFTKIPEILAKKIAICFSGIAFGGFALWTRAVEKEKERVRLFAKIPEIPVNQQNSEIIHHET